MRADYGLRIRQHPDGMIVTALNKMAHGQSRDGLQHKAEAYGFKVLRVDGHNPTALDNAFKAQKTAAAEGKPLFWWRVRRFNRRRCGSRRGERRAVKS